MGPISRSRNGIKLSWTIIMPALRRVKSGESGTFAADIEAQAGDQGATRRHLKASASIVDQLTAQGHGEHPAVQKLKRALANPSDETSVGELERPSRRETPFLTALSNEAPLGDRAPRPEVGRVAASRCIQTAINLARSRARGSPDRATTPV